MSNRFAARIKGALLIHEQVDQCEWVTRQQTFQKYIHLLKNNIIFAKLLFGRKYLM